MVGLRYASSITTASDPTLFGVVSPAQYGMTPCVVDTYLSLGGEASRVYLAPSRYSAVRKVGFWVAFRHEQTGGVLGTTVRLRIGPDSTSAVARNVKTGNIPSGGIVVTRGTGDVWGSTDPTSVGAFYNWNGQGNTIAPLQFATLNTEGSQLVYMEFDRFEAGSADFFNDWDAVAAQADDDLYMAFWVAIERVDSVAWAIATGNVNNRPQIVTSGAVVQQAPAAVNKTCLYLPAHAALFDNGAIVTSFGNIRPYNYPFRASQMEGTYAIYMMARQASSGAAAKGRFSVQIMDVDQDSVIETLRDTQTFVAGDTGQNTYCARSTDILSAIVDGDDLNIKWRSDTGASQDLPAAWWEVIQTDFNRTTVYFHSGGQALAGNLIPGGAPPPDAYSKISGLIDPTWIDLPEDRIIEANVIGAIRHISAGNDADQLLTANANLDADVSASAFNQNITPEISTTPNATPGFKMVNSAVLSNDPLNQVGKRKLTTLFGGSAWTSGGTDIQGGMGLAYVLNVPNSEFLDLGPVFELGAFNPEGCAATSAGLGEPGLLIITNGSTIPKKFNPTAAGTAGEIEDAGIPLPFEGELPSFVVGDTSASPTGGLDVGFYNYRYTFRNCCTDKESDPSDVIEVDTTGATPAAVVTFSFAGVRIPADEQICEICLYRTIGALTQSDLNDVTMAKVGCFDPDLGSTFEDTLADSELDFANDGISFLNAPPPCAPIVVDFRNRLFMMGDIPNLTPTGTVSVVEDSDIITGDGNVEWDRCLEGKFIQVGSDCRNYEIFRVLPPETGTSPPIARLKLVEPYEGGNGTGESYVICGRPNRLWFSEPLEPEYWPAVNFIDVEPGDGDRLMGAVSNFDRLVICKRRKTYVLTFREQPAFEVLVPSRISSDVGCVGPRTFAQGESGSYWLADRGVASYDGRTVRHVQESEMMNDIFVNPDNPNYVRRDRNGRVIDAVGVFYPKREQYLLLLPTIQTDRGCNIMLVWDIHLRNITLLKFCQEFQSMVVAKDSDGNERVYIGDTNGFVWILDAGDTDGVGFPNATGTVRGTVTSAGVDSESLASVLVDISASFITGGVPALADLSGIAGLSGALDGDDMGLAGVCLYTRPADAALGTPWTVRTVYAATEDTLYVTPPWGADAPGVGDEYMIGAIDFTCVFKPQNYGTDDVLKRDWRQVVTHEVENFASELRVELLPDFASSDPEELTVVDEETQETGEGRVFKMDSAKGRQVKPVGRLVHNFMGIKMTNFAPEEPIRLINHALMTTPRSSK